MANSKQKQARATHNQIFDKLRQLTDQSVVQVVEQATAAFSADENERGLALLQTVDERLGGYSISRSYLDSLDTRNPAAEMWKRDTFRPFWYLEGMSERHEPAFFSRRIIECACAHIEGAAKEIARQNFGWMKRFNLDQKALGILLHDGKMRKVIPQTTWENALWLNNGVYRQAKHKFSDQVVPIEDEHRARLFELDEALAVYFIARVVGLELLRVMGFRPKTT